MCRAARAGGLLVGLAASLALAACRASNAALSDTEAREVLAALEGSSAEEDRNFKLRFGHVR